MVNIEQFDFVRTPRSPKADSSPLAKPDTCRALKAAERQGQLMVSALSRGLYPGMRIPHAQAREIRSVGFWDAPTDQQWGLDWHCNEGVEIGFLEYGRLRFQVGRQPEQLDAGTLTITRPWQRHRVGCPCVQASRYHWLILDVGVRQSNLNWHWPAWILLPKSDLDQLTRLLRFTENPLWRANQSIARAFNELGRTVAKGNGRHLVAKIQLTVNELLICLLELMQRAAPVLDATLTSSERAVRIFLESFKDRIGEPWTLDSMASETGLGRSQFSKYCRQITNCNPSEFLNRTRVSAACDLFRMDSSISVTDVAMQCGFQSSQYFATVVRTLTGTTPGQLRDSTRSEGQSPETCFRRK